MSTPEREPLSFDDAQILRLESATIKGHTGKVLIVGPGPSGKPLGAAELRERVAERIEAIPRLRQRVDDPRSANPAWVEADPDLDWHVAEAQTDGPLDEAQLRELAGEVLAERLDHERPLWRIDVVPMRDGEAALIGRVHHAMADGVSAIRMVGGLLWDPASDLPPERATATAKPGARAAAPAAAPSGRACAAFPERFAGSCARDPTQRSTTTSDQTARSPGARTSWHG